MKYSSSVLRVDGLSVGFNQWPVLSGVSFTLPSQSLISIVGASGAGKSTLLRGLAGLLTPLAGSVALTPRTHTGTRAQSMVFQNPRLLPWRSVQANVELGLEGLNLNRDTRQRRAQHYLAQVELSEYADRWPFQLSGGQQQRVGLARALAVEPQVLFMDEPFAALDAITRRRLQQHLIHLRQSTSAAIIFVTHDIEEAVLLGDRVLVLGTRSGDAAQVQGDINVALPADNRRAHSGFRGTVERVEWLLHSGPMTAQAIEGSNDEFASRFSRNHF